MTMILNHTIVPARDKVAAARWFASIFGLNFNEQEIDHFAPIRVSDTLTLLFDQDTSFDSHHYAFHVSEFRVRGYFPADKEGWIFIR
jgi:catechol 2,3-dioxygenase-like lactoylglutathione lyase family enzyme